MSTRPCPDGFYDGVRRFAAGEYYEDYYAVFFLDPDGIKLEGMKYGEQTAKKKKARKSKA